MLLSAGGMRLAYSMTGPFSLPQNRSFSRTGKVASRPALTRSPKTWQSSSFCELGGCFIAKWRAGRSDDNAFRVNKRSRIADTSWRKALLERRAGEGNQHIFRQIYECHRARIRGQSPKRCREQRSSTPSGASRGPVAQRSIPEPSKPCGNWSSRVLRLSRSATGR